MWFFKIKRLWMIGKPVRGGLLGRDNDIVISLL